METLESGALETLIVYENLDIIRVTLVHKVICVFVSCL